VISDKDITDYTPLQRESKGDRIVTQYDMYTIGEDGVGLLKMDFLGLRNLTIMSQALNFIKKTKGIDIDLEKIPLNDKKSFDMLSSGETTGIFQLESAGMRRYIKELKPTTIFDVMAMVALYRPGPMATIPEFIARKHNPSKITYPDPRLEAVLKTSYGIICYQDDVLLTSIALAGYTWEDADKLRKAVGKKIQSEMVKQREKFIQGCVANGLSKTKAEEIFGLIEPFAGYGFNKAHAACYAMIAYNTAYLKSNYTVEFMTAVLTAETRANTGDTKDEKISMIVEECRRMGIQLLPPDINKSETEFSIFDNSIRFGLSAVKNVGSAAIESIISARNQDGLFKSLADIIRRVDTSKVNRKTFESLIRAGAMDTIGNRSQLLAAVPVYLEQMHRIKKNAVQGQVGLFDDEPDQNAGLSDVLPEVPELSHDELLSAEKELLGFYFSAHPMTRVLEHFERLQATEMGLITDELVGQRITICGMITTVKKIFTKATNQEMAFVKLLDLTGVMEVVVFPKVFSKNPELWTKDAIVLVSGKVDQKDEQLTFLVDDAKRVQLSQ
jgi:DNA polymerase III subunit alpha